MGRIKPFTFKISEKSKSSSKVHPVENAAQSKTSADFTTGNLPTSGGSFFQIFKESVVAGAGATLGSRAIDSVLGPRTIKVEHASPKECSQESLEKFYQCVKTDPQNCDDLLPLECKSNNK